MSVESVLISHVTASGDNHKPYSRHGLHRHWKRQAASGKKRIVRICTWCANPAPKASDGQVTHSHGMCARCFDKLTGGAK